MMAHRFFSVNATITVLAPGAEAPTGTVSFFDGVLYLGTVNVSLTSGKYVVSIKLPAALGVGKHFLTAVYSGDNNVPPSASQPPSLKRPFVRAPRSH